MSKQRFVPLALAVAALAVAAGCTEDPLYPEQGIQVTAADLPPLAGDAVYELWLSYPSERASDKRPEIDHGTPEYFSVGRFTVDATGALRSADGNGSASFSIPVGYNPSLVAEALLSVEPRSDNDSTPDAFMLSGRFLGTATRGHAILQLGSARTFDTAAINGRSGSFVLEAPTSASIDDSVSGIWFLKHQFNTTTGDSLSPGIDLPTQPLNHDNDVWTYESWLAQRTTTGVQYISLGRFRNPANVDDNGAGPGAGPLTVLYRFPGEDFISPRRSLADSTYGVIVSLQPEQIPLAAPLVRLLELGTIGRDVASGEEVNMIPTAKLPIVEVTIER